MSGLLHTLAWLSVLAGICLLIHTWIRWHVAWPFTFPWRMRRAMIHAGLVRRHLGAVTAPKLHRKRREGDTWHLTWTVPVGVTVAKVEDVRDALEEHLDASIARVWSDRGRLHMRIGTSRLPDTYGLHEAPAPQSNGNGLVVHIGTSRDGSLDADLTRPPHTLIGGTSGGGKSALVQSTIFQLARRYTPGQVQLVLVDLKGGVDMAVFDGLPHLKHPIAGRHSEAAAVLTELVREQEQRQDMLRPRQLPNIGEWNKRHPEQRLPYVVCVIDEFAEMLPKDARGRERDDRETAWAAVSTLTRMGRASGVHVIIATQRPDADVLPGQIRANCGRVIALRCTTRFNSEILLGPGNNAAWRLPDRPGLAIHRDARETMVQIAHIPAEEIVREVAALRAQYVLPPHGETRPPLVLEATSHTDSREENE